MWSLPRFDSSPQRVATKFKNKGLIVIGQDVWERDLNLVEPFVKEMGSKMTYRVALDTMAEGGEGRMAQTWMLAAGRNGIPTAFLVDKRGIVAWIGHPMQLKEALLEEVLAGTFNTAKAAAESENRRETEQRARTLWNEFNRRVEDREVGIWQRPPSRKSRSCSPKTSVGV